MAVRGGKGSKDGMGFFGAETAQALRAQIVEPDARESGERQVPPECSIYIVRVERAA